MSARRAAAAFAAGVTAAVALVAAGSASADAQVLHESVHQQVTGTFFNICDLSQGPDSPTFTASGFADQQLTLVQRSDLQYVLSIHEVTQLVGSYPDGRRVVAHSDSSISEIVDVDPSSLQTGQLVLDSALVATTTQHDMIHVAGTGGAPDENMDGVSHLTYTPDLRLASLVVDFRGGCE
jgi:hypothetical protein